jgi:hypothetical protein
MATGMPHEGGGWTIGTHGSIGGMSPLDAGMAVVRDKDKSGSRRIHMLVPYAKAVPKRMCLKGNALVCAAMPK